MWLTCVERGCGRDPLQRTLQHAVTPCVIQDKVVCICITSATSLHWVHNVSCGFVCHMHSQQHVHACSSSCIIKTSQKVHKPRLLTCYQTLKTVCVCKTVIVSSRMHYTGCRAAMNALLAHHTSEFSSSGCCRF